MKLVMSGSSGLIGGALTPAFQAAGHEVIRLVRRPPRSGEIRWDPANGKLDAGTLVGIDGAINLSGTNIATRWTDTARREIRDSRLQSTRLLSETLARLSPRPQVLLSVSAVGYYGDRGEEILTEESPPGESGFLPSLVREWEGSTAPARDAGIRVVTPRLGVVLARNEGALGKMLLLFKLGLGARLGSGRQWFSWVAIDDVVAGMLFLLENPSLDGAVNLTSPSPVRSSEFTDTLGRVLSRPTLLTVPPVALYLAYGKDMPRETLLASTRVLPQRLQQAGYSLGYQDLKQALKHVVGER
jgi:uncharacterized protein